MEEEDVPSKKSKKPFGKPFTEKVFYKNTKSVTFEELLIKLVFEKDKKFMNVFLKTFYTIPKCTPLKILQFLISLYENPNIQFDIDPQSNITNYLIVSSCKDLSPEFAIIRASVINLIKEWIECFQEFFEDPPLVDLLEAFLQHQLNLNITTEESTLCNSLMEHIKSVRTGIKENPNISSNNSNHQQHSNIITPTFLTSKYSYEVLAQQVSHFEYVLASKIQIKDFYDPMPKGGTPISKYFSHFSKMRMMIITEITKEENKSHASLLVQKAVKMAEKCIEYNNYNTAMEILSALFSPVMIEPDKGKLWESLPVRVFETLQKLCFLLSPDENYESYKQYLMSNPIYLPLIAVHIADIRFINVFYRSQRLEFINIEKLYHLYKELSTLLPFYNVNQPKFPIDEDFQQKFSSYVNQFPEFQSNLYNKPSNYFKDERPSHEDIKFKFARDQFETFYIDSMLGIKEDVDFTVSDNQMRQRDWVILSTNSMSLNFEKSEIIFKENDNLDTSKVYVLSDGIVSLSNNNVPFISIKAPSIIAESTLMDSSITPQITAESQCSVTVVDKDFLYSLLDSDPHLSLRFFSSVTIQVIEQLKNSNIRQCSYPLNASNNSSIVEPMPTNYRVISKRLANVKIFDPNLERDREVKELFSWRNDEVVIKKYDSTLCGKFNVQGSLFLTQNHVCFYSKVRLNKSKIVIPLVDILNIKKENQKILLKVASKKTHVFRIRDAHEEALGILTGLVKSIEYSRETTPTISQGVERRATSIESWQRDTVNLSKTDAIYLTESDWEIIMRGAKHLTLHKNDVVIKEHTDCPKLFRILSGTCRIETLVNNKPFIIASIGSSEVFGEIGFIERKGATASVIIDSDKTQLAAIEGHYLLRLFKMKPVLASKFMYHLVCAIRRRIGNTYWYENQEERRVVDIILEPIYNNFGRFPITPIVNTKIIHSISGPPYNEMDELINSRESKKTYVCALSISTYPIRTRNRDDQQLIRDGHPICDQYKAIFYHNRIIAAISDGCNWGEAPRSAALSAINGFTSYLQNHHTEGNHLQFVSNLVQRAFSMANSAIMLDKAPNANIGTTTLLGGIVLQLESDKPKKGSSNWGLVYGSIGDCKVFHWSVTTGVFSDITQFNRNQSQSATDPGGRLGPHINGNDPDLRNFELGFFPCAEGDYFILVSDGVHDNLDPALLGFDPRDVGIDADKWDSITDYQYLEEVKTTVRLQILEKIIFQEVDKSNLASLLEQQEFTYRKLPSPETIVHNIIDYCKFYCQAAITFMQDNPSKRLPKDYKLYPGKMDHTTLLCFVVGHPVEKQPVERIRRKKEHKLSSPLH